MNEYIASLIEYATISGTLLVLTIIAISIPRLLIKNKSFMVTFGFVVVSAISVFTLAMMGEIDSEKQQYILNKLKSGDLILMCKQNGNLYSEVKNIPISLSNFVFTFKDGSFINYDACKTRKSKQSKLMKVKNE